VNNPFIITGRYVSDDYFCDREAETNYSKLQAALKALLDNGTIVRDGETYRIDNHFFSIWLSRR